MAEKNRRYNPGGSKGHNLKRKDQYHKMANVVNHEHFERHHGFESAHHPEGKTDKGHPIK